MRRSLLLALVTVVLGASGALTLSGGAGAGENNVMTTIIVRKVVVGTGTGGSTVHVACTDSDEVLDLDFDAMGNPTTSVPSEGSVSIVGGAWQILTGNPPSEPIPCTFTETATGGATTTSWTCAYSSTEPPTVSAGPTAQGPSVPEVMLGCAAASGAGVGPATVTYGNFDDNVETQTSTVTFTNQFVATSPSVVADPVVVAPAFTG